MTAPVYYNENDREAAAWLAELMVAGEIPAGEIDTRSIEDVRPNELAGFRQCHFFAGIGGWPDDRPVWTGSCPCQPFSGAGKRGGTNDPRHLWPAFRWLVDQCRPATVFGEQVASKAGRAWWAGVQTDLEAMGYAAAAADLCAAGIGAPHIRQRLFWVGHAASEGLQRREGARPSPWGQSGRASADGRLGHTQQQGLEGHPGHGDDRHEPGRLVADAGGSAAQAGSDCGMADASKCAAECGESRAGQRSVPRRGEQSPWQHAEWIDCADGKARRIEPGLEPLVDGIPRGVVPSCDPGAPGYAQNTGEARKMRLSGYGNAIVPALAAEFIRATIETESCK